MDTVSFFEVRSEVLKLRIIDTMCRLFVYVYLKHPYVCRCEGDQIQTLCLCYPLRRNNRAEERGRREEERKRWEEERKRRSREGRCSLPLNGSRRFGRNIIANSIDATAFIDYSVGDLAEQHIVHVIPICSHEVSCGNTSNGTCL